MPQLSQLALVYQSQWFWLLLVLGAIYIFVGHGIVPKVEATVGQRDTQIAADLAEAERLRAEADATEEAWRAKINGLKDCPISQFPQRFSFARMKPIHSRRSKPNASFPAASPKSPRSRMPRSWTPIPAAGSS